ncbi:PspC domain-containing protein [Mucilaginibacter gynuensis]|uniref:PspC domain-containing protein n=1 Tax=Mucilaginibacter gynuensis TaxID=1302236 RepID=A0ABP8GH16_9SPHI
MNKTIIININGTVFHIEEDAYEILKAYMTDVKRHFMHSADSLEITTDIENRIAEMFSEILARESKPVIVEQDVKLVVEQMGTVQDFETAEEDEQAATGQNYAPNNYTARKLFRDPDDHLIAGVCAGIANYFDIQSVWVRLLFAIATLFGGAGFIIYVILWIVVPRAISRADRMAMKGEKLNLQGFKKNFEEEMGSVKENLKNFQHEARPFVYKTRDFFGDFFQHLRAFFSGSGMLLAKIFGMIIILSALAGLVGLIVSVIAFLVYGNSGIYNLFPFNIVNHEANTAFLVCGFLILAMPLLTVTLLTISAVFKSDSFNRTTGYSFLIIWIVSLCTVIYYTAKATADFRASASFRKNINIVPSKSGTYYLKLNDIKYLSGEDSIRYKVKERFNGMIIIDSDDNGDDFDSPGSNIRIEIEKSDVDRPILVESFSARGRDYEEALLNARNVTYQFTQQDSVLKFSSRLEKPTDRLWRNQRVRLTLRVPMNTKLVIDTDLGRYLDDVGIYDCNTVNKQDDAPAATFIMTADGIQCKVDTLVLPKREAVADTIIKRDTIVIKHDTVITKRP